MTPMSTVDALCKIALRCSEFIATGTPLYKGFPSSYGEIDRVKVRFRRGPEFGWLLDDLTQYRVCERYVRAYTRPELVGESAEQVFYVFPTNGYKALWIDERADLTAFFEEQSSVCSRIANEYDMRVQFAQSIRATTTTGNIERAALDPREIFIYDIPDFYIVNVNACTSYSTLLDALLASMTRSLPV